MTELECIVQRIKEQLQTQLTQSTYEARRCCLHRLLKTASGMGIEKPCQELFDVFAADDYGSKDRRFRLDHCVKLVDAYAGTNARRLNGKLYNELTLPSLEKSFAVLQGSSYPVESLDIGFLIVKAEQEMTHLCLTASTIGQYRHAWKDIQRYFFLNGSTIYNETAVKAFVGETTRQKDSGQMKTWKWKINRKAAHVLMEVAETGHFEWSHIREEIRIPDEGLEKVRRRYLSSLESRNLEKATINLHDYVFRNALINGGVKSIEELKGISAAHVEAMVEGFSDVCNKRSLSTILPMLRKVLDHLYTEGFGGHRMSGMIMRPFAQKCNVASWISRRDEKKITRRLEHESKRDRAIVLLALRLGLRDGDICNLTSQEIDWANDRISLTQTKTGKLLTLPLLPDVGNALMDYILDERPTRNDSYPYVFLRAQAPYNKLSSVYRIFSELANRCKVAPANGKATGSHLFRYTLVHRLLEAKVPHQVITDALGHTSKESDKPYLSMEESMLRMCALDLSAVGSIGWGEGAGND